MRIATWNINSVRLRLGQALRLIDEAEPDVLCLQETKVADEQFPRQPFAERGYRHIAPAGFKGWHGVAIVSRLPLRDVQVHHWCGRRDGRHVSARLPGGVEVHTVYVPSGGDLPDPELNEKFAHKLSFLEDMAAWWPDRRSPADRLVLAGDLNVAPLETDVWSHVQLVDVVSHTPVEVDRLDALRRALGWVDAVRHFVPADRHLYTWWSYRARDWQLSDRGRRLDHVWVTRPLVPALRAAAVLKAARDWPPKPSDHVPVVVDLDA